MKINQTNLYVLYIRLDLWLFCAIKFDPNCSESNYYLYYVLEFTHTLLMLSKNNIRK